MPLDILPDKMDDTCMLCHLYNQYQPIIQKTFIREKAKEYNDERLKFLYFYVFEMVRSYMPQIVIWVRV